MENLQQVIEEVERLEEGLESLEELEQMTTVNCKTSQEIIKEYRRL